MNIFEVITANEKYFQALPIELPNRKTAFVYKGNRFFFYSPTNRVVSKYIDNAGLRYSDFDTYGKVIIDGLSMLLIYLNFKYYGITKNGVTRYLGTSMKNLKIREIKQWKSFV